MKKGAFCSGRLTPLESRTEPGIGRPIETPLSLHIEEDSPLPAAAIFNERTQSRIQRVHEFALKAAKRMKGALRSTLANVFPGTAERCDESGAGHAG